MLDKPFLFLSAFGLLKGGHCPAVVVVQTTEIFLAVSTMPVPCLPSPQSSCWLGSERGDLPAACCAADKKEGKSWLFVHNVW
uniref:Secreted protein n=1 Tax=Ditylenchus dipsaci TaxID=166011 RepID=A0A915E8A5_9BILA